jgi:putative DNA primase/helicase
MDYLKIFKEMKIDSDEVQAIYPRNDIGVARLFHHLHSDKLVYVTEQKSYYLFDGKRWGIDGAGVSALCTNFVRAYAEHAKDVQGSSLVPKSGGHKDFEAYAGEFHRLSRRKAILEDARAIAPKSIVDFDSNPFLLNLQNGTFDFEAMEFREHRSTDHLTKIARVDHQEGAVCERWLQFVIEIMDGNDGMGQYLQKALGYGSSGDTSQDCFFYLYGPKTRNGKSTLTGTIEYLLGDYAMSAQPQTLARRNANGAAPSPDIARLKGARFVNMQEPSKGLELDAALVKQLTGGDAVVARFLGKNPVQYTPTFKIFMGANHLPKITDRSVLTSGRLKVIPFNRHFKPGEQDENLTQMFKESVAMSGILNWLIQGFAMYRRTENYLTLKK